MIEFSQFTEALKLDEIKIKTIFQGISPAECEEIGEALKTNKSLVGLHLYYNKIGSYGIRFLSNALSVNKSLRELHVFDNNVDCNGAKCLADNLLVNRTLSKLHMGVNSIGNGGMNFLGNALKLNSTLTELSVNDNGITCAGVKYIAEALKSNRSLKILFLQENRCAWQGAMYIGAALKLNDTLEVLNLSENNLGDIGIGYLFEGVSVNRGLAEVEICSNHIGAMGAKSIASALRQNKRLAMLDLGNNEIGDVGLKHIALALHDNQHLEKLHLQENEIGDELLEMGQVLKHNDSLIEIHFDNNRISADGAKCLAQGIAENKSLSTLDLRNNDICNTGAKFLADSLSQNRSLANLLLPNNNIGDEGIMYFAKTLKASDNYTILKLALYGNIIGKEGPDALYAIKGRLEENAVQREKEFESLLDSQKKITWNEARIMFVGDPKSGKSSLIHSLLRSPAVEAKSDLDGQFREFQCTTTKYNFWKRPRNIGISAACAFRLMVEEDLKHNSQPSEYDNEQFEKKAATDTPKRKHSKLSTSFHYFSEIRRNAFPFSRKSLCKANSTYLDPSDLVTNSKDRISNKETRVSRVSSEREKGNDIYFNEASLVAVKRDLNSLNLRLWDFNCDNLINEIHTIFSTPGGVCALVFDMRKLCSSNTVVSNEECSKISSRIRSINWQSSKNASKLVIVGTFFEQSRGSCESSNLNVLKKIDEIIHSACCPDPNSQDTLTQSVVKNSQDGLYFFPVNSEKGIGIDNLRSSIERLAMSTKEVRVRVPMSWVLFIEDILSKKQTGQPYITIPEMKDIATNVGILSNTEQYEALRFFKSQGFLTHFTSTETLSKIIVIDPEWVVRSLLMVSEMKRLYRDHDKVAGFKQVGLEIDLLKAVHQGVVSRDLLEYIWNGDQVEFLLELKKQTMLLSEWVSSESNCNSDYISPSLLNAKIPDTDLPILDQLQNEITVKCIFDFSTTNLQSGLFHKFVSLWRLNAIRYRSRDKMQPNSTSLPAPAFISRHIAKVDFENGGGLYIFEDTKINRITVGITIQDPSVASKCLDYAHSLFRKLNFDEIFGKKSYWRCNTLLENCVENTIHDYDDARRMKISPWFETAPAGIAKQELLDILN